MLPLCLLLTQAPPSVAVLDQLLKARDVAGLNALMATPTSDLQVIRTNGAYDTGAKGWHALETEAFGSTFVVFTTPLTSEDVGELLFRREGTKLAYIPERDALGVKLKRHQLDLRFNLAKKEAILADRLSLTAAASSMPLVFRMSPQYHVNSIESAGRRIEFKQQGGVVLMPRPGGDATYEIHYSAIVDLPEYAGSISEEEATLTNDYWYPMVARQPVPYDLAVRTPKDWIAVCQGLPVGTPVPEGDSVVTKYKMDLPVVFYSVSAAPFKTFDQRTNGKLYRVWSLRMASEQAAIQNAVNPDIIEFYSKCFGPWPFDRWGALDSAVYGGGALEAYSYATYGDGMLPSVDPHETAHTFFGGVLNNTYLRSFWNESFAVFCEGLYERNGPIGNAAEKRLAFVSDASPDPSYRKVAVADGSAFAGPVASALGYGKGAKVLQMLEQVLGTPTMIATMKAWVEADRGKEVSWEDYERVVARTVPNKNLKPFFDDWLRKPGYADLRIAEVKRTGGTITFQATFNGESYVMPLDVLVEYADGSSEVKTLMLDRPGAQTFALAHPNRAPKLVSFDPYGRALRTQTANESPTSLQGSLASMRRYTEAGTGYLPRFGRSTLTEVPRSLVNVFVVGHPDKTPAVRELCRLAGFSVQGKKLTWKGTTIDLDHGSALAVVDLPGGGTAMVGLGTTKLRPNTGRARLALVDEYGRFLRGVTEHRRTGGFAFRL